MTTKIAPVICSPKFLILALVVVLSLGAWLAAGHSTAAGTTDVTLFYEATVTSVDDFTGELNGSVSIGDTITGTYSYDADTADRLPGDPTRGSYGIDSTSYGWTFNLPSGEFTSPLRPQVFNLHNIFIENDLPANPRTPGPATDRYVSTYDHGINFDDLGPGLFVRLTVIELKTDSLDALSDDLLSATPPDPADFNLTNELQIFGCTLVQGETCNFEFRIKATVTRLSTVGGPVDTTPPVITRLGNDPVNVVEGSSYADDGATASDDVDGDITTDIVTVNPVDVNVPGTYTVTYDVSDAAGNPATQVTRTINVITAGAAAQNLSNLIIDLGLPQEVQNSLTAPLKTASKILSDDNLKNDGAACGKLNSLTNKVDANEGNGKLTPAQASQLRQEVQAVEAALGCA